MLSDAAHWSELLLLYYSYHYCTTPAVSNEVAAR